MKIELRKVYQTDRKLERYIRALQDRGVLSKIVNENGYMCYDSKELENYKKKARVGRPNKY